MSPKIAYHSLSQYTRSIILTSGTLAPLHSFRNELQSPFPIATELGNLSDIQKRCWIGTISHHNNVKLQATFQESESFDFRDALGDVILRHIAIIPNGVLCFFPSYSFLEKMVERWNDSGIFSKMAAIKTIFKEPRNSDEFKHTLKDYYECVESNPKGALLFAICRGKVSEGMNFSDQFARGVICVGIPFPNRKDLRVDLKYKYNDQVKKPNEGISGNAWYTLQAYRALNQALGRCIRHRNDYGSILLIDYRFTQENNWTNLSKWARTCINNTRICSNSIDSLKKFYSNINNNNIINK